MICVEIPLRTLRDQITALEQATEPGESIPYAAGAIAALAWMLDPVHNQSPVKIMLTEWCAKGGVH